MKIWVRRGGVNAQAGLDQMRQLGFVVVVVVVMVVVVVVVIVDQK